MLHILGVAKTKVEARLAAYAQSSRCKTARDSSVSYVSIVFSVKQ
jgi:predicted class III extradiol MEMO1 family dioxygenase